MFDQNKMSAIVSALRRNGQPGLMNGLASGMQVDGQIRQGKGNRDVPAPVESRTGDPYAAPNIQGTNPYGPPPGSMTHKMGGNNLQAMIDSWYAKKAQAEAAAKQQPAAPTEAPLWADTYGG